MKTVRFTISGSFKLEDVDGEESKLQIEVEGDSDDNTDTFEMTHTEYLVFLAALDRAKDKLKEFVWADDET